MCITFKRILFILASVNLLTGCGTLRAIGSARVFLDNTGYVYPPTESFVYQRRGILCIQPPAEAVRLTDTEITIKLEGVPAGVAKVDAEGTVSEKQTAQRLNERAQVLIGLRDREYTLCHTLANNIQVIENGRNASASDAQVLAKNKEYRKQYVIQLERIQRTMELVALSLICTDKEKDKETVNLKCISSMLPQLKSSESGF